MDPVADLARLLAPGEPRSGVRLRQGKIISVVADGTATITIGGDPTQVSGVAVASHVSAVPGVACWLVVDGRDAFVIATIGPAVAATPTGVVLATAAASAPGGWLLCNGAAVSRTTYARLFAVIGSTYGAGDGTTTFNVPDFRGRVVVGRNPAQTEFDALGKAGGATTHTLTEAETPRTTTARPVNATVFDSGTGNSPLVAGSGTRHPYAGINNPPQAHNNLQPYRVLNHIIKI